MAKSCSYTPGLITSTISTLKSTVFHKLNKLLIIAIICNLKTVGVWESNQKHCNYLLSLHHIMYNLILCQYMLIYDDGSLISYEVQMWKNYENHVSYSHGRCHVVLAMTTTIG